MDGSSLEISLQETRNFWPYFMLLLVLNILEIPSGIPPIKSKWQ